MNIKVSVSDKVEQQLTALGWRQDDILRDSTVSLSSQAVRPDVVLLYNVYPLSIIFYQSVLSSEDLDSLTITAMLAAEEIGVSCAYVTDGAQIFEIDAELSPTKRTSWPAPLELVTHLGYDTDDPRLFPPPSQSFVQLRLYQAVAVARALDALLSTKRTAVISMAVGSGLTVTAFQIAWKLLRSGRFKRLLFVGDAKYVVAQTKSAFAAFGEYLVVLQHWTTAIETASVHLVAADDAVNNETLQQLRALPENYYDVIVALDVQRIDENLQVILHQFPAAIRLAMTYRPPEHSTTQLFGPPVFSYSREDVLFDNPIQVPEGFHVVSLKEIATVTRGVNSHNFSKPSDIERKVPLILGQNIHPDGNIIIDQNKQFDLNAQPIRNGRSSFIERYILQENDILISAINSRIFNRIAIVTADLARQEIIFGSSLICVRVDPKLANPVAVYKFFRSDVGQIALQQQASQLSSNLLLSTSILAQIKIFLPPISELSQQTSEQLSGPANTLRQLQNEIIPDLEKLARVQMDNPNTAENPGLPLIADKLRQI